MRLYFQIWRQADQARGVSMEPYGQPDRCQGGHHPKSEALQSSGQDKTGLHEGGGWDRPPPRQGADPALPGPGQATGKPTTLGFPCMRAVRTGLRSRQYLSRAPSSPLGLRGAVLVRSATSPLPARTEGVGWEGWRRQNRPGGQGWGTHSLPRCLSEPGRAWLSGFAGTCPAQHSFQETGLPTRATQEGAQGAPGPAGGPPEASGTLAACATPPGHRRGADTPPQAREGGARRPWRAARTRATSASGRVRGLGGDWRRGQGEPMVVLPQLLAESSGSARRVPGKGGRPSPAAERQTPASCPPCASPPLVSTPMALPAPDIRSFSRSTVAMAALRPAVRSPPAPRAVADPAPAPPRAGPAPA